MLPLSVEIPGFKYPNFIQKYLPCKLSYNFKLEVPLLSTESPLSLATPSALDETSTLSLASLPTIGDATPTFTYGAQIDAISTKCLPPTSTTIVLFEQPEIALSESGDSSSSGEKRAACTSLQGNLESDGKTTSLHRDEKLLCNALSRNLTHSLTLDGSDVGVFRKVISPNYYGPSIDCILGGACKGFRQQLSRIPCVFDPSVCSEFTTNRPGKIVEIDNRRSSHQSMFRLLESQNCSDVTLFFPLFLLSTFDLMFSRASYCSREAFGRADNIKSFSRDLARWPQYTRVACKAGNTFSVPSHPPDDLRKVNAKLSTIFLFRYGGPRLKLSPGTSQQKRLVLDWFTSPEQSLKGNPPLKLFHYEEYGEGFERPTSSLCNSALIEKRQKKDNIAKKSALNPRFCGVSNNFVPSGITRPSSAACLLLNPSHFCSSNKDIGATHAVSRVLFSRSLSSTKSVPVSYQIPQDHYVVYDNGDSAFSKVKSSTKSFIKDDPKSAPVLTEDDHKSKLDSLITYRNFSQILSSFLLKYLPSYRSNFKPVKHLDLTFFDKIFLDQQAVHQFSSNGVNLQDNGGLTFKKGRSFSNAVEASMLSNHEGQVLNGKAVGRYHVILLNHMLLPYEQMRPLLLLAQSIYCADGAANRLWKLHLSAVLEGKPALPLPDLVCGDLDSIETEVVEAYGAQGVTILKDPSQYTNDLQKCWDRLEKHLLPGDKVIILGAIGGRFDQTIGNIRLLYRLWYNYSNGIPMQGANGTLLTQPEIYMVGDMSFCTLLSPGTNLISLPSVFLSKNCGLLPLDNGSSTVFTEGLKYNIYGQAVQMSHIVSSSNLAIQDTVTVKTSGPVIWYSELELANEANPSK